MHTSRRTPNERHAKTLLESAKRLAHRRVADTEALAGGAEPLRFRHGDERRHAIELGCHWTEYLPTWTPMASRSTEPTALDCDARVNRGAAPTAARHVNCTDSPMQENTMPMTTRVPSITLNNGVELPALGLGVFQSPPAETV